MSFEDLPHKQRQDKYSVQPPSCMDRFKVEVISQHPNPQQTIYAAMHQDYAEAFVWDQRNDWPSEEKAGELIIRNLLKGGRGHFGPLEHPQIVLNCGFFPHSTMQQIRTHRVGLSFDVQCLAGDTEITFVHTSGSLRKYPISELYDLWHNGEKAIRERKIRGRNGEPPGKYRRDCKNRLRKMRLRVLNEDSGFFETSHLKSVMCSGKQPVYRVTLSDGKTLDCTTNHRLFTSNGWQHMGDAVGLVTGANYKVLAMTKHCELMCNGVLKPEVLYMHKSWLEAQSNHGLNAKAIASLCKVSPRTIRYWAKRHDVKLPSGRQKGLKIVIGNGQYRSKAWLFAQLAKGHNVEQMALSAKCSTETIEQWVYHHALELNRKLSRSQSLWNKETQGYSLNLSKEQRDFRREISICKDCHTEIHSQNAEANFLENFKPKTQSFRWLEKPKPVGRRLSTHPVEVSKVEFLGLQTTYDLEVEGPWHNFVGNGVVVHNSFRYTGSRILDVANGKVDVEDVFYLRPVGAYTDRQGKKYDYTEVLRKEDLDWCIEGARRYKTRIEQGFSEEHARGLIPFDVRQHWIVSANARSLMHLLDLRWKADAQLEAQKLCEAIWPHFKAWVPAVADWYETNRLKKARLSP